MLADSKYNPAAQMLEEAKNNTYKGRLSKNQNSNSALNSLQVQGSQANENENVIILNPPEPEIIVRRDP